MSEYDSRNKLQRIARTLEISEDAFLPGGGSEHENLIISTMTELSEIIDIFCNIQNSALRRGCLDFVRDAASKCAVNR
ncbi:hypothetical protein ACLBXB_08345 [Methylobacterium mesophilicum]